MMFSCLFSITHKHLITENEKTFTLSRQISSMKQSGDHFQYDRFIANKRYYILIIHEIQKSIKLWHLYNIN